MTLANLSVLAYQELTPMPSYNGYRAKQLIRARSTVLEGTGERCSGVRNNLTGVEGQWGFQMQRLPTYCRLATTDTIARLAQIEEHAAPTAHSAPHLHTGRHRFWCGYPRFNHRTRACRLTAPAM